MNDELTEKLLASACERTGLSREDVLNEVNGQLDEVGNLYYFSDDWNEMIDEPLLRANWLQLPLYVRIAMFSILRPVASRMDDSAQMGVERGEYD